MTAPSDTPTLSPADRARVDAVVRDVVECSHAAGVTGYKSDYDATTRAESALTATVAALVAEAEARGREAGAKVCESRAASHRGDGHRGWAGEAEDCALAIRSATPTPTPHAPGCQSRFPMRGAPLPCNCAKLPTPTEGDPR